MQQGPNTCSRYNSNPLLSPHWAAVNVFFGFALFFWVVTPALYYTNTWFTAYLPFCTADVYDRFGQEYNSSAVITGQNFDEAKYQAYSPPYLPATFAFVYGLSFASITSVLSHVYFFHWEELVQAFRGSTRLDIHARMMKAYKKVPVWWWFAIILVMLGMSFAMTEVFHTGLPVWGIILALVIASVYMIPCGMIQGVTNVQVPPSFGALCLDSNSQQ